jgi:class 3 adenylate cyclase
MALKDDLDREVKTIFASNWTTANKTTVPDPASLGLGNDAGLFEEATVLYADLDGSTAMVDHKPWYFSAEIYKTYLHCAAKIIRAEGGTITAYDGDRIMAVFTGNSKNTSAVRCAMRINYAVIYVINPALQARYPDQNFVVKHVVGIDSSQMRVARIGVRGDNDLVWVGRAANYAAKLTTLSERTIWITPSVHDNMHESVVASNGTPMWEKRLWTAMNDFEVYGSNWWWTL